MVPKRQRVRHPLIDDWVQLRLLCTWPDQEAYELIRPIVLFGRSPAERARQTGTSRRSLYRKVSTFTQLGLAGLRGEPPTDDHRRLPEWIRQAIRELKAEHAALNLREIATICYVRFGHRPSHHTVETILAEQPLPPKTTRRFPPYRTITDSAQRRLAIIHLHTEGWNVQIIATYLQTSRPTVYATLQRWATDAFADLADHSHRRKKVVLKTDLQAIAEVRRLQENPELGEFRIHAALKQQFGIDLSPRTCGRILALDRQLCGLERPPPTPHVPQAMPFKATRRHQYWTVDLRYLDMHTLGGGMIYVISILENDSRVILASMLSRTQDLAAFLSVLLDAVERFGSPEALVSDSGSIFLANDARRIYAALGIEKEQIESGQAWQSYIETTFNIQRRGPKGTPDWHFAQAKTWPELQASHERWLTDYNAQDHWAHLKRADQRRSPNDVLSFVRGKEWQPEQVHQIFRVARGERSVRPNGDLRFRHWDLSSERGLARHHVAVWLAADVTTVTIEYAHRPLAQYSAIPDAKQQRFKEVALLHLFENHFPSPQLSLWENTTVEWRHAIPRPGPTSRHPRGWQKTRQPLLFPTESRQAATG